MSTRHRTVALAGALLLATLSCISERAPLGPPGGIADCALPLDRIARGDLIVIIRGQQFLPDTARVRVGQAVTWVNCEDAGADPHTSTAVAGLWDSPLLPSGAAYSRTFETVGTFPYTCVPHPHMRGAVVVQ